MRKGREKLSASLFDDIVWGVQHDAFENELGKSLLRAWSVGACDEQLAKMIHDMVHPLRMQEAFGNLIPFRKPRLREGELTPGLDLDGDEIRFPLQWLNAGFLIGGNTGSSKTNLLSYLAIQIAASGCNVWISEMYKTQARHLMPIFNRQGMNLIVLRALGWKYNLLQAGPCNPRVHLAMAEDLLNRVLDLPPRAKSIMRKGCHNLYEKFSIWEGRVDAWPCLFDLYEWVFNSEGLNLAAREAILDRLGSLLTAFTPKCAAYRLAWNPSELTRFSIVFEMRGTPEFVKQLLLASTLYSVLQHEVERGVINNPMSLFIAFEDSQRFFDDSQEIGGGEIAPMDELAGVIRGSAKGLGVIVQTMSGLSRRLASNLAIKIMGRMGSHEDYNRLGSDLALNHHQLEWAKRNLKPGIFAAQVAEGDWREPFIFRVPYLKIPAIVKDCDVEKGIHLLNDLPTIPALEYANWKPDHVIKLSQNRGKRGIFRLSDNELRYLKAVIEDPGKPSSFYSRSARISGKRTVEIRKQLVENGYLREHRVATGQRGRNAIVLEPLKLAYEVISQSERE